MDQRCTGRECSFPRGAEVDKPRVERLTPLPCWSPWPRFGLLPINRFQSGPLGGIFGTTLAMFRPEVPGHPQSENEKSGATCAQCEIILIRFSFLVLADEHLGNSRELAPGIRRV